MDLPRSTGCDGNRGPAQLDPGFVLYLISEKGMSARTCRTSSIALRIEGTVRRQQRYAGAETSDDPGAILAVDILSTGRSQRRHAGGGPARH